jgi:RecG-like helicase
MLLKNHLIEVFKKASSKNNFLLIENVVLKWVHRFGIESLNDLLIHAPVQKENKHKEESQEQIRPEALKTSENSEEIEYESKHLEIAINNEVFNTNQYPKKINKYSKTPKLPLPFIKNLRKWINKNKIAS